VTTASETLEWPDSSVTKTWLLSEAADFWIVCAGGGILLIVLALALHWCGDRELSAADVLLGELHLGATYDAVARGRLWRRMPFEVIVVPLCILALTYALMYGGYPVLVTTAALYLAAWHRGRQNLGIARLYQLRMGGALSPWHSRLFRAAVYLPMAAGVAYYTSTAELDEGAEYIGLGLDTDVLWVLGALAGASLAAYLVYTVRCRGCVHPGERWLVVANALAFGTAYVLGAWTVSFILVLALHHEIQYLYFTYAMARRSIAARLADRRAELRLLASCAVWPVIGLASWAVCKLSDLPWLVPFLTGGLLCHYWLDSRIWTARARRLAGA
jgi:hypothetical protein